ncbi:hypothetical protein FX988_01319 [Paraglaciecola mesophila]|uniref:YdhG-like domain-containing protein n=1 Tax=Paraglaciecola mesophila TaxID=197222 RepID=A0A857JJF9_9ALTE|nr:DUF1801 domain-containing protein [Paraglaciecola mesophila]QHJ11097.1 hypothetical protein FX988_01319 [Paraglaciecola mesophila]
MPEVRSDIADYIDNAPPERRVRLTQLVELIQRLSPQAVVSMRYKMPTFTTVNGWISVANQKHYVSVYTCQFAHIAPYKKRYPKQKTGKGCINFTDKDQIDLAVLSDVILSAMGTMDKD